jgi:integrase
MEKTRYSGIYKREGRTGTTYYVVAYVGIDASGRRKQKWHSGYRSLHEARDAQTEIRGRLKSGTYVEPSKMSLREYVEDEWLPSVKRSIRPSTFESYAGNLRRHVLGHEILGGAQLRHVTPGMLNKLYGELAEARTLDGEERPALAPQTIRYVHTITRRALADAVKEDRLARNPADRATPPKPSAAKAPAVRTWTAAELRRFLELVAEDRLFAAWRLSAMTGMRRGELLGLRWHDLDLDGDPPRVQITTTLIGARKASTPKTESGRRTIDLDPVTAAALRAHRARQAQEKLALGPAYDDQGLLFCREDGTPAWPRTFSRAFETHVQAAELPRIPLKNLRHTHATLLLSNGVPPKVIQERLGHADITITLRVYAHAIPAMHAEATLKAAAMIDG